MWPTQMGGCLTSARSAARALLRTLPVRGAADIPWTSGNTLDAGVLAGASGQDRQQGLREDAEMPLVRARAPAQAGCEARSCKAPQAQRWHVPHPARRTGWRVARAAGRACLANSDAGASVCSSVALRVRAVHVPQVYLDVAIKGRAAGRIVLALFYNATPLAAENFRSAGAGAGPWSPKGVCPGLGTMCPTWRAGAGVCARRQLCTGEKGVVPPNRPGAGQAYSLKVRPAHAGTLLGSRAGLASPHGSACLFLRAG